MDKETRKELKSDHLVMEVEHGVEYVQDHRKQFIRYGAIAAAAIAVVAGIVWYQGYRHEERQAALAAAMEIPQANVGPAQNEFTLAFPTQDAKDKAWTKAFSELAAKYPGSDEGVIGEYYIAVQAADKGNFAVAEKGFKSVAESGEKSYASVAKLALAQVYQGQGKQKDAEQLIRSVMENPTAMVSKEQAIIALARCIAPANAQEARKLLEPLRANTRAGVSRAALSALGEIPQK